MSSHFKTIAYTDAGAVFSRSLRRRDAWTDGDMHAIRRLPHQLFEGVGACTFLHSNRLSSCCRREKYPHSTEPVPPCQFEAKLEKKPIAPYYLAESFSSALKPSSASEPFFCHILWRQRKDSICRVKRGKKATPYYVAEAFVSLCCIDKGFGGICAILSGRNPP